MSTLSPHAPQDFINPLWTKGIRARLRLKHIVSMSLLTVTITSFVSLIIYLNVTERSDLDSATAAKFVLPGLIVIQSVILMILGTNAVASGVSLERDQRLLDYQRMTPMSPTSKVLGYMFGLPAREYFMFALTLPFMAIAIAVSGLSLLTVLHFYAVFFTSVWVYHMTGLVAGMVAPKARMASMMSMGLVCLLYFVLPNLSRLGITYFEFLTIRPTFFGLIMQELPEQMTRTGPASQIDTFRDVPFFSRMLHPTVYTIMVQGFLLATMFTVVHRRWRDPACHILSKAQALLVYAGVTMFLAASIWPMVADEQIGMDTLRSMDGGMPESQFLRILLTMFLMISIVAYYFLIMAVSPSRDKAREAMRRTHKLGHKRIHPDADGATSFFLSLGMVSLTVFAAGSLIWLAVRTGRFFEHAPEIGTWLPMALLLFVTAMFVQSARERLSLRAYLLVGFVLWVIPIFATMILFSAEQAWVVGTYVSLPSPPASLSVALANMFHSTPLSGGETGEFLPPDVIGHEQYMIWGSILFYAGLAAAFQLNLRTWNKQARAKIWNAPTEDAHALAAA